MNYSLAFPLLALTAIVAYRIGYAMRGRNRRTLPSPDRRTVVQPWQMEGRKS